MNRHRHRRRYWQLSKHWRHNWQFSSNWQMSRLRAEADSFRLLLLKMNGVFASQWKDVRSSVRLSYTCWLHEKSDFWVKFRKKEHQEHQNHFSDHSGSSECIWCLNSVRLVFSDFTQHIFPLTCQTINEVRDDDAIRWCHKKMPLDATRSYHSMTLHYATGCR